MTEEEAQAAYDARVRVAHETLSKAEPWAAYEAEVEPARAAHLEALEAAWEAYEAAMKEAQAAYDAAVAPAWAAYEAALKEAQHE